MRKIVIAMAAGLAAGMLMTSVSFAGVWETDGCRWQYRNDAGSYTAGQWIQENGIWYYIDENGIMKTGWFQEGDKWYYLNDSGAMSCATTLVIDGVSYTFDGSGVWLPDVKEGWNGNTFTNASLDYQVTVPDGFINLERFVAPSMEIKEITLDFAASAPDMTVEMMVMALDLPFESSDVTAEQLVQDIKAQFVDDAIYRLNGDASTAVLGGYEYAKLPMVIQGMMNYDVYFRKAGQSFVFIGMVYEPGHQQMADEILAGMRKP